MEAFSEMMQPSPIITGPWVELMRALGWRMALSDMVIRWMPVRTAVSAMTQVGAIEVGALGSCEDGRGLADDIAAYRAVMSESGALLQAQ